MSNIAHKFTPDHPPETMGELYPRAHLLPKDLPQEVTVTIERVSFEFFAPHQKAHTAPKELLAQLHFVGKQKILILNKTKSQQLAAALDRDFEQLRYDELPGKTVTLYTANGQNGKPTICIKSTAIKGQAQRGVI